MATKSKFTEAGRLESYRVALENIESQEEIAAAMAELSYDTVKIKEGKNLLAQTRNTYDQSKEGNDKKAAVYAEFDAIKKQLREIYIIHRKKARIVFKNDETTADRLAISSTIPRAYVKWLENMEKFYTEVKEDTSIQTKIERLKISQNDVNNAQSLIQQMQAARVSYIRKRGEAQEATKEKNKALAEMDKFMSEVYAVARIALKDKPQLLEALGKIVKS